MTFSFHFPMQLLVDLDESAPVEQAIGYLIGRFSGVDRWPVWVSPRIKGGAAPYPHRESRDSRHKRRGGFAVYR